jgi:hypothetical protein
MAHWRGAERQGSALLPDAGFELGQWRFASDQTGGHDGHLMAPMGLRVTAGISAVVDFTKPQNDEPSRRGAVLVDG